MTKWHFDTLKGSSQDFTHMLRRSRSFWSWEVSSRVLAGPITLESSAYNVILLLSARGESFMKILNMVGPRTLPCGTPLLTFWEKDRIRLPSASNSLTCWTQFLKKSRIHLRIFSSKPIDCSLSSSLLWQTLSNAFEKSRRIMSTGIPNYSSFVI